MTSPTVSYGGVPNGATPQGQQHAPLTPSQRLQGMSPAQKAMFQQYIAGRNSQSAQAAVNTPTGATSLGGMQQAGYNAQANRANEAYQAAINNNQFQQGQLQNSYLPRFRDMATRQGLERAAQPNQFIGRGILGSGLDMRNLTALDTQHGREHTDLTNEEAGGLSTLRNARNQIEQNRSDALSQIEANRMAALSQLAVRQIQ